MNHKAFVEKLGTVLSRRDYENQIQESVLGSLCEILSESRVDKDIAGIIHPFLTKRLRPDHNRILPRILNLLCTKDGVYNKEVYLEEFDFDPFWQRIKISDLRLIGEALTEKLKIKRLNLGDNYYGHEILDYVADMLSRNSNVEKLDLFSNNITKEGAKILAGSLCRNSTLKELDLTDNRMLDIGAKAIITALTPDTSFTDMAEGGRWSALQFLSLMHTMCSEQSAFAVGKMLRTNDMHLEKTGHVLQ